MKRRRRLPDPSWTVVGHRHLVGRQIPHRRFAWLWSPVSVALALLTLLTGILNVAVGHRLDALMVRLVRFHVWLDTGHQWPRPQRE